MTKKTRFIIYFIMFTSLILGIYAAFEESRFISLFFTMFGYLLANELYKYDRVRKSSSYELESNKENIFNKQYNIAILLIPLLILIIYGIFF